MMRALIALLLLSAPAVAIPRSYPIVHIMLENTSYEMIVGKSYAPYFNSLIKQGTLETSFHPEVHGSWLVRQYSIFGMGISPTVIPQCFLGNNFTQDNFIRRLVEKGGQWRAYNETMPAYGSQLIDYTDASGNHYGKGHVAATGPSDSCLGMYWSMPLTGLYQDLANQWLPDYAEINVNYAHDCHNPTTDRVTAIATCDTFLSQLIPQILALPYFQPGGTGLLVIDFDEGNLYPATDSSGGGGHAAMILLGPKVKVGATDTTCKTFANLLRTFLLAIGASQPFPGNANQAGHSCYGAFVSQ